MDCGIHVDSKELDNLERSLNKILSNLKAKYIFFPLPATPHGHYKSSLLSFGNASCFFHSLQLGVSKKNGTPKSSNFNRVFHYL